MKNQALVEIVNALLWNFGLDKSFFMDLTKVF
jgi:hypothetical protein